MKKSIIILLFISSFFWGPSQIVFQKLLFQNWTNFCEPKYLQQMTNGDFIIVGNRYNKSMIGTVPGGLFYSRLDSSGNVKWLSLDISPGPKNLFQSDFDSKGNFAMVGIEGGITSDMARLFKADASGNLIWTKRL